MSDIYENDSLYLLCCVTDTIVCHTVVLLKVVDYICMYCLSSAMQFHVRANNLYLSCSI